MKKENETSSTATNLFGPLSQLNLYQVVLSLSKPTGGVTGKMNARVVLCLLAHTDLRSGTVNGKKSEMARIVGCSPQNFRAVCRGLIFKGYLLEIGSGRDGVYVWNPNFGNENPQ